MTNDEVDSVSDMKTLDIGRAAQRRNLGYRCLCAECSTARSAARAKLGPESDQAFRVRIKRARAGRLKALLEWRTTAPWQE